MPPTLARLCFAVAIALITGTAARAADVTVTPAPGGGFVVKDAAGASERLRVQESGAITLPGVPGAAAQSTALCMSDTGLLGPCPGGGSGGGPTYTAATGLSLTGTTFSVAQTYQLPQGCTANQIAQWNSTTSAWACASASGAMLPAGTVNRTLRYDASNAPVADSELQVLADGGVLATDATVNAAYAVAAMPTGTIPATGAGARMMWYPAKAAFRSGLIADILFTGTAQWDDAQVGRYSFASGLDTVASNLGSTATGEFSTASGNTSVAMGFGATASGDYSIAMGNTTKASGGASTAMGYQTNAIGSYSTAMGQATTAAGVASVAMGVNASTLDASAADPGNSLYWHHYSFVYGDGSANTNSTSDLQFMVRASGGFVFYTSTDTVTGIQLPAGSGSWTSLSDRNAKDAVRPIDARDVLARVVAMPVNTWHYKTQDEKYRHIGPMAQDFRAAFGLGETDKGIDDIDAQGVALAAIQGLDAKLGDRDKQIAELRDKLAAQDAELSALQTQGSEIAALKAAVTALQRGQTESRLTTASAQP